MQGEMPFPVLTQALYLGTKPGAPWTRGCLKLPEDMPDSVKELSCARSTTRQLLGRFERFPRKGGKGWHWEGGGESTVEHETGYLFKCSASFLVTSHLLGILGRKYLISEPGN